jgi:hypothetical protein
MGRVTAPEREAPNAERRRTIVGAVHAKLAEQRRRYASVASRWRLFAVATITALVSCTAVLAWRGYTEERLPNATNAPKVQSLAGDVRVGEYRYDGATGLGDTSAVAPVGQHIATRRGSRAQAELRSGALVTIEEQSELRLPLARHDEERLRLVRGKAHVSVPELSVDRSLSLLAADAVVIASGARFNVELKPISGRSERVILVEVDAGSVWVESAGRRLLLSQGGRWSSEAETSRVPLEVTRSGPASDRR